MKQVTVWLVLMMVAMALTAFAASNVIGVAISNGKMVVNRSEVTGNANLSDGATLRSISEPLRIQWVGGGGGALAPHSSAQVFGDRLVLREGQGVLTTPVVRAQAGGFEVRAGADSQAQVTLHDGKVQVAALTGTVQVRDAEGVMLAQVQPGKALDFLPGSGLAGTSTMRGTLRAENGHFFLKDQLTNLDVEVRGGNFQPSVGWLVEVRGRAVASADSQSQVIEMASLTPLEAGAQSGGSQPTDKDAKDEKKTKHKGAAKKGAAAGAAGAAAGGTAAATTGGTAAAAGISHGAMIAIGVAVAGGAAAAVAVPLAVMSR
jgi:hypothetical protein